MRLFEILRFAALTLLSLVTACASSGSSTISVDVVTDFVAGIEFVEVVTTVNDGSTVDRPAALSDGPGFLRGQRVASVSGDPGELRVQVDLIRANGAVLATRTLVGALSTSQTVVTVVITRSCEGIVCDDGLTCIAGQCVREECDPSRPLTCPSELLCTTGADCDASRIDPCATMECLDSVCLATTHGESCAADHYCNPALGCLPLAGPMDAGPRDVGPGMDAADGPCADDAGSPLAAGSVCRPAAGECDTPEVCDGGSVECPTDVMLTTECRASTGACDVAETCSGTDPVCPADAFLPNGRDCGELSCGGFGQCGGFSDSCDLGGTQSRSCTARTCMAGVCGDSSAPDDERACSRTLTETCDLTDDDCDGTCDEGCRIPIYRFFHPGTGDHYYKRSSSTPAGYTAEGIAFYVYLASRSGLVPYYSCLNGTDHFMTRNSGCESHTSEGVLGYVRNPSASTCGSVPLYRFVNATVGDNFYSRSSSRPSGYSSVGESVQVWATP